MSKFNFIILVIFVILMFPGCDDEKNQTSHPDEGGITLTTDWSKAGSSVPTTYQAYIVSSSGETKLFENLSGTTNNLVVKPGDATFYVFNKAENVSISDKKVIINNAGVGIVSNPGLFYSFSGQVTTVRDRDIAQTAQMERQIGELKISLAIKPAMMIDKIKTINATFDGIASELNMQTKEISVPSVISTTFSKNSYYATATARLFGFIQSAKQSLKLNIEFENGKTASVISDISSLVDGFNTSKNTLFSLNASMYVDENAATAIIDNWERNAESRYLSAYPSEISLPGKASDTAIAVITDQQSWGYSIIKTGDWITTNQTSDKLELSVTENLDQTARQAIINISAGGLIERLTVTQKKNESDSYSDKEVVILQSATIGKGVNIIMMGDGYTSEDMVKRTGKYECDMRTSAEHFFSVYPFTRYRDYFNVYMITAVSNEAGLSDKFGNSFFDTKFETIREGGNSTEINCNTDIVIEYLEEITDLSDTDIHDLTVIMPINADIYSGTCYMFYPNHIPPDAGYSEGFSICMCPVVSNMFKEIIVHEAVGHGFSKVVDEYIYNPKEPVPDVEKDRAIYFKQFGWAENIDFYSDIMETSWSGFADNPKYGIVSTFEGALTYGKGVWRPENNSCMNDNVLYFNAPTRWAQVRRIMKLAGISYSLSQFLQDDVVPEYPTRTRRNMDNFIPLAPPVIRILNSSALKR